jgi:hypothetical protein
VDQGEDDEPPHREAMDGAHVGEAADGHLDRPQQVGAEGGQAAGHVGGRQQDAADADHPSDVYSTM